MLQAYLELICEFPAHFFVSQPDPGSITAQHHKVGSRPVGMAVQDPGLELCYVIFCNALRVGQHYGLVERDADLQHTVAAAVVAGQQQQWQQRQQQQCKRQ